jgi:aminoglycoside phosphotransferase (APT) family kinase protein
LGELRELGIPRVVVQQDELLVTDWIEGTPLKREVDIRQIEQAADLLARIHTTPSHAGTNLPRYAANREQSEAVIRELEILVRAKQAEASWADALTHSLHRTLPAQSLHGIVHGDFCAENLVIDTEGELRIVDNEALRVDCLDSDLARVWVRWPMPEDTWRTFVGSYRKQRPDAAEGSGLLAWQCRQLIASASWRVERHLPGAGPLLDRLQSAADRL